MLRRDVGGVEALPMTLLLGVLLGTFTLGLGVKCLTDVRSLLERERAVESFDTFVERARVACAGGRGSMQQFELELPNSRIIAGGRLLQLSVGDEIKRSEIMPLPILLDGREAWETGGGRYSIELQRSDRDEYFLKLRRL